MKRMEFHLLKTFKPWFKTNEPTILAVTGVTTLLVAGITGAISAVKLNKKLEEELAANEVEHVKDLPFKTVAKHVGKYVVPPVVLAGTGSYLVLRGNYISLAALGTAKEAINTLTRRADSMEEAIAETVGEKKQKEIRAAATQKEVNKDIDDGLSEMDIIKTGHGVSLFQLFETGQYFRSTELEVQRAVDRFNKDWGYDPDPNGKTVLELKEDSKGLYDLCKELGIEESRHAVNSGWHVTDMKDRGMLHGIEYSKGLVFGPNNEPCCVIYLQGPVPRQNYWEPLPKNRR